MSKSNLWENDLLKLLFNGTPIANIADNAATAPLVNLYVSLHTADPGEAGVQTTSEATYTAYARQAVLRDPAGWVVTANSVSPVASIDFPEALAGSETVGWFGVGTNATGNGRLLYSGVVSPTILVGAGVVPRLLTASTITED